MWTVLRKAYDNQLKMKARIYQRKDPNKKSVNIDDNEAIVVALLQEAVNKFPQKFPMSMFFEPGAIDGYRKVLAQQSSWTALKGSLRFPSLEKESPENGQDWAKQSTQFRTRKLPERRSISVQTDGPAGSSDIRFNSSRPVSRVGKAPEAIDFDDRLDTERLAISGERLTPTRSPSAQSRQRQKRPSNGYPQIGTADNLYHVEDDDHSSITFNQSSLSVDGSADSTNSYGYEPLRTHDTDGTFSVSAVSLPPLVAGSTATGGHKHTNSDDHYDDPTDGAASDASRSSIHSTGSGTLATLLSNQSTTYGYMFPKGGVEPKHKLSSALSLSSGGKPNKRSKVKYMRPSPAAVATFMAQQRNLQSLPPANVNAMQSRMEELDSWREERLSRDKKNRLDAVRSIENAVSEMSLNIHSIVPTSPMTHKLSPLMPSPPNTRKAMGRAGSSTSIRSSNSGRAAESGTAIPHHSQNGNNADDCSVASNVTMGTLT
jgi:hypothetical protein